MHYRYVTFTFKDNSTIQKCLKDRKIIQFVLYLNLLYLYVKEFNLLFFSNENRPRNQKMMFEVHICWSTFMDIS